MNTKAIRVLLAATLTCVAVSAQATNLTINGFASIYAGQALSKKQLSTTATPPLNYDTSVDFQEGSKFGIQFLAGLNDKLSATAQIMAKGKFDFAAKVTWAYFTYHFNDNWTLKAGRQRIPSLLYADFLDVGYAYSWATPPEAVYNTYGFDNLDGLNIEYLSSIGDWTSRANLVAGRSKTQLDSGALIINVDDKNYAGATWNLNYDWFTFQVAVSQSKPSVDMFNTIADNVNSFVSSFGMPLTADQLNQLNVNYDQMRVGNVGVLADWGTFFASAEYSKETLPGSPSLRDHTGWYVTGGFRWNKLTFNLTGSSTKFKNNTKTLAVLDSVRPLLQGALALASTPGNQFYDPYTAGGLSQLIEGLDTAYRQGELTRGYSFSIRYDFDPAAAFKIEYNYYDSKFDNGGLSDQPKLYPSFIRMGVDLVY